MLGVKSALFSTKMETTAIVINSIRIQDGPAYKLKMICNASSCSIRSSGKYQLSTGGYPPAKTRLDLWGNTTYMGRCMASTTHGVTHRSTRCRSRFSHCVATGAVSYTTALS